MDSLNNAILFQMNRASDDPLDLITIANNYNDGVVVNHDQEYWVKELDSLQTEMYHESIYPTYAVNELIPIWKQRLSKLDYIAHELFLSNEYLDVDNNNSLQLYEIYTRWVHWICIQLYYIQKDSSYRIQFDLDSYKECHTIYTRYIKAMDCDSEIAAFRDLVVSHHLPGASAFYYQQKNPDAFVTYFDKEFDASTPIPDSNVVLGDTQKQFILDYINIQFEAYSFLDIFYTTV